MTELLAHAERLASEEGLEALTMHRLAAVHGVRVAALYRYWPSKDALLGALLGRVFDQLFSAVAEARLGLDGLPDLDVRPGVRALARLVAAARAYQRFAEARPEASALLTRSLAVPRPVVTDATSAPTLLPRVLALAEELGADLQTAREAGMLADGDDAMRAVLLWTSLQGLVGARKMSRFGIGGPVAALERELVRTLFSGWGAPASELDAALAAAELATRSTTKSGTIAGTTPATERRK